MIYTEYLRFYGIALRVLGLWPTPMSSRSLETGYRLYSVFFLGIFCLLFNISEFVNLFLIYDELRAFAADMCWFLMHFAANVKIVVFLSRVEKVGKICASFGTGLFTSDFNLGKEEADILASAVKRSVRLLGVYYLFTIAILMNGFIAPIYRDEVNQGVNTTRGIRQWPLPYYTYVYCDVETSPCYEIAYGYQTLSTTICSLVIIHLDNLYLFLVTLCCSELRILNLKLERVCRGDEKPVERRLTGRRGGMELDDYIDPESPRLGTNCVKHHHAILEVSQELEDIYNLPLLAQFLSHLVQLCFQMFVITEVSLLSFDGLSMIAFVISMVIEVYLFCECGNEIETESTRVSEAAYNAHWTSTSKPAKRTLLLMMLRAQRPVEFTVGKFAKLSLSSFLGVLRGSFSYFMVLREIQ